MKTTPAFLSHYSAAAYWRVPHLDVVLAGLPVDGQLTHITHPKCGSRYFRSGYAPHSCTLRLPRHALVSVTAADSRSFKVASPELTFVQLAAHLSIHRLILLGLQMCAHPPGHPEEAITSLHRLTKHIKSARGHRGIQNAKRAIHYIENGSASIMESLAFMVLSLPHSLGGYGLGGAVFNFEIELDWESQARLGQNRCFVDLFYKDAKLAVEYDSFAFHNSPADLGRDAIRAGVLKRHGLEVLSLSTIQLYDRAACEDFAYNLASRIGKRLQIRTNKFRPMHSGLRDLLPVRPEPQL